MLYKAKKLLVMNPVSIMIFFLPLLITNMKSQGKNGEMQCVKNVQGVKI